jgi:sensor histidine kinase YesM
MDPEDPERTGLYYRVAQMQEDLAVYALRLAQATLHQGAEVYQKTLTFYQSTTPSLTILLLFVAGCAVTGLFGMLDRSLLEPIVKMSGQSRKIAENDFAVPDLSIPTDDEMGELILAFNRMKHATRDHITTLEEKNRMESELHHRELERLELEKNLDHTRLEMLKSQVNPHFLFNTLNMISCMARMEDAEDTDKMILSLSGIFRYNLRTKEQEVLLEQELEALDDYIYIQQTRFDGRIAYKKQVQVDPLQVRIPSFTLQPIVENAFIHGLSRREEGGRIFLRIWQEGTMLSISVADNGRGMTDGELADLHRRMHESEHTGRGIGLGNISRRISMLYTEGDLRIHSRPGRGTVIQCRIPQSERRER